MFLSFLLIFTLAQEKKKQEALEEFFIFCLSNLIILISINNNATAFQFARLYFLPNYVQCRERETILRLKTSHITLHGGPFSASKSAPTPNVVHINERSRFLQFLM